MINGAQTARQQLPVEPQAESIIIEPGFLARNWWLLRRAFVAAYEDNCFGIAKGAAYSGLLSLFPILTIFTAILIQANAQAVVHVIERFVQNVLPPGTEDLVLSRLRGQARRGISLPVLAVVGAVWAGSGAMASLMEGFQAAYRIPSGRPFLQQRAMAVFLLLIAAFPAVGASSLIIFGNRIEAVMINWAGMEIGPPAGGVRRHHFCHWAALLFWTESPADRKAGWDQERVSFHARLAGCTSGDSAVVDGHYAVRLVCESPGKLQPLLRQRGHRGCTADLALPYCLYLAHRLRIQRGTRAH